MVRLLQVFIGFFTLLDVIRAQCATADHLHCPHWVRNGFCSNERYTQAHLQQYCPNACDNSGCRANTTKVQTRSTTPRTTKTPTTTTTATTTSTTTTTTTTPSTTTTAPPLENANCMDWNHDPANFFCASATKAQKQLVCKVTCAKDIDPIEDCVRYYQTTENTAVSARTYKSTSWLALHVSTLKTLHFYVKAGITVSIYDESMTTAGTLPTVPPLKEYKGPGFFKLTTPEEQNLKSWMCQQT